MFNDILASKYRVMSQTPAQAGPGLTVSPNGQTVGAPTATFGKGGLFGNVPVGGTGTVRGFTATNAGPGLPAVISGSGSPFGMMDTLRTQGYTPAEATAAVAAGYGAEVDQVNTRLRPGESASNIALNTTSGSLNNANAYTVREQGAQVAPLARSAIGYQGAQGAYVGAQTEGERQINEFHRKNPNVDPTTGLLIDPATGLPVNSTPVGAVAPGRGLTPTAYRPNLLRRGAQ